MTAPTISFVPAAGEVVTLQTSAGGPVAAPLPAVDAGNPDVVLTATIPLTLGLGSSAAAALANSQTVGALSVPAGVVLLLTAKAGLLANSVNPLVVQSPTAGAATFGAVQSPLGTAGTLTFQRGAAGAVTLF